MAMGRPSCIGKPMALTQLRCIVELLITEYDFDFAPNEDGEAVWRDLKDQFTSHPGKLHLVFTQRARKE